MRHFAFDSVETFFQNLFATGQPVLDPGEMSSSEWVVATLQRDHPPLIDLLEKRYEHLLLELPGEPLAFHPEAALWGAKICFALCAATVFRDLELPQLEPWLRQPMPHPESPAAHLSTDPTLCYLPEIRAMICKIATGDPLLGLVDEIARAAPLSSVGIECNPPAALETLFSHPGIDQLHSERIVAAKDLSLSLIHI